MRSIEKALDLELNRERVQNPCIGLDLTFGGGGRNPLETGISACLHASLGLKALIKYDVNKHI